MESIISTLVNRFDRGTLTRRELIQGLTMLAAGGAARAAAAQDAAMKTVKIDHISIQVRDLQRAIRMYLTLMARCKVRKTKRRYEDSNSGEVQTVRSRHASE